MPTTVDNCPQVPNPDQVDADRDGMGDACDPGFTNTWLRFDSDPGEWVGNGIDATWYPVDGTFTASHEAGLVRLEYNGGRTNWSLEFAGAQGVQLAPGAYEGAVKYTREAAATPRMNVSGSGRGCNTLTGRFDVVEAVYGSDGEITRFAADFEQHCEGAPAALWGSIRYESSTAFPVPAGPRTGTFQPLSPARILDTRTGNGAPAAKLGPGRTLSLQATGRGGVPTSGVSAVVMNVTVTDPSASSYLTAWPAGTSRPTASNLNYVAGETVPNLVVVKVGTGGKVNLYNAFGSTNVVADVVGWYSDGSVRTEARYQGIAPARILDTRTGNGAPAAKLGPGRTLSLQATGRGGVPTSGVSAVVMNVTVTDPSASSYLTAWPAGTSRPTASNLNYVAGETVPNLVVVKVGTGGKVNLYNAFGSTNVVADVVGWYTDGSGHGARYQPMAPLRILDTRALNAKLRPQETRALEVLGTAGVPIGGVSAVVMNVTVTEPTASSYLTVWRSGNARPTASNFNYVAGQTVPNLVVVKVGFDRKVNLYNAFGSAHVVADVVGWYSSG